MQNTAADPMANRPTLLESACLGMKTVIRWLLVIMLGVMSVLISYQVIMRYLSMSSALSEELLRYLLIWSGILGAAYCFLDQKHLNLPLLLDALPPKWERRLSTFNSMLVLIFGMFLTYGGFHAVAANSGTMAPMLQVSMGFLQSVLVLSGIVIVLSQIARLQAATRMDRSNLANLTGAAVFIAAALGIFYLIRGTEAYDGWVSDSLELTSVLILFGTFFTFLVIGLPIALGLAFAGLMTLSLQIEIGDLFSTMGEQIFSSLDSFGFLALPFFVLAGNIMNESGIARRLIDFAMLLGRRIPGSLWQTNIIANMLFGCLSGSGIAAATAIGGIVGRVAKEDGYDMAYTTAVNASSAPTGMLIPPSGTLILYSLITGGSASVVALFLGGYLPGIIMGASVMFCAYLFARKHGYPVDKTPLDYHKLAATLFRAIPSLMLVVVVIGGIIGGIFTATEGSGVAVLYSLVLALCYRKLTLSTLVECLAATAVSSGVILFLISCSSLMSWSMTFASIPDTIGQMLISVSDNKYVILMIINITLLIVGVFMDMAPAMLIFTPILFPIVTAMGVHPVHFGIIITYNLCMGVVTPPVGTVLFVSCGLTGEKITTVSRALIPIFATQIAGLLLVTYIPWFSLGLPRLFGF